MDGDRVGPRTSGPRWAVAGIVLVALAAGMLVLPGINPWIDAPGDSPAQDGVHAVGAIGTVDGGAAGAPTGSTSPPPTTAPGSTTGSAAPSTGTGAGDTALTARVLGLGLLTWTITITNPDSVAHTWTNVTVTVPSLGIARLTISSGAQLLASSRSGDTLCIRAPESATVEAGGHVDVTVVALVSIGEPRNPRVDDAGCAAAAG